MHYPQLQLARKHIVFRTRRARAAFLTCALWTLCGSLPAQTGGTGAISGTITDPTGALVVHAQIKVTDVAAGYTRTSLSNDHGFYVISLLPPGQYTLEVSKQGFKVATAADVQVIVAEPTVLNIRMETGAVTETVSVAASSV